ncbi:hypothetical protein SEVIR_6G235700v4 [Setaria viridis]|uniref:Uncharacterized protein n=1 Tax=Setaria viridis TaxID=4556 RepID=A0A4V6D5S6_SETVI|nr:uncharacterized protein LOC117861973 [Setaria viridis]TKW11476.1 hypothetical protein SEVIR_6G235700v2 [Setaria viridis]
MKSIGKAAEFLRKAVGALRGKAAVLRARLLFLASLRRRMVVVAGISRHIRALAPRQEGKQGREKAAAQCRRGEAVAPAADDGEHNNHVVGLPELARLFEQVANEDGGDGGYADDCALTLRLLFDDEGNERRAAGGFAVVDGLDVDEDDDEPSVIDVIRSRREGDGLEFRIEDEIDQAADMYITRVRRRIMNAQTELGASGIE